MWRVQDVVERNVRDMHLPPVTINQNATGDVVPNSIGDVSTTNAVGIAMSREEIAYLQIFNVGPGTAYVAFGRDADNANNYVAILAANQMYDIKTRERVSVFASGGNCVISRVCLVRTQGTTNNT